MGFLKKLFGTGETTNQGPKPSKEVSALLQTLESEDMTVRMTAVASAVSLLGNEEPGALLPFITALGDEQALVRGSVAGMLAQGLAEDLTRNVLVKAVKNGEDGRRLLGRLEQMKEDETDEFAQSEAERAWQLLSRAI